MIKKMNEFKGLCVFVFFIIASVIGVLAWADDTYASREEIKTLTEKVNDIGQDIKDIRRTQMEIWKRIK